MSSTKSFACGSDVFEHDNRYSIYIRTVRSKLLFPTLLNQFKLVYGPFWQSNMHRTFDFCPRPAKKETTNVKSRGPILCVTSSEKSLRLCFKSKL